MTFRRTVVVAAFTILLITSICHYHSVYFLTSQVEESLFSNGGGMFSRLCKRSLYQVLTSSSLATFLMEDIPLESSAHMQDTYPRWQRFCRLRALSPEAPPGMARERKEAHGSELESSQVRNHVFCKLLPQEKFCR